MITEQEYVTSLKEMKEIIEDFDRRIAYRRIELIGSRATVCRESISFTVGSANIERLTPEEEIILSKDKRLAEMMYERNRLSEELLYIIKYAEYPPKSDKGA